MYAIGIDIGTTSICGVVLDTDTGRVVASRTEMSNAFIATDNPWEKIQDAEKVISIAVDILERFKEYPARVIGLTGQMHGIVYVDEQGRAVSPLYTWQDARGDLPYKGTTYAKHLGTFTGYGNVTDFYNQVNHLRPEAAVSYCTIMDYLGMVLCGRKAPLIHITNAAGLGCYDMANEAFQYPVDLEVTKGFALMGNYKGIPVSVAIGDNQASVFSTLADEEDLLINVGTGSQVSVISDTIRTGENIETRPYFEDKYLIVGAALCGGRAYGVLKNFYGDLLEAAGLENVDVYELMNGLIAEMQGSPLVVDTRFAGTRTDPLQRGQIQGIGADTFTPANLTFGVLEGMMAELNAMYLQMDTRRSNIVGSGNGIRRNKTLVRIAENLFGGRLKIPAHTEEAAYGAAMFGLVACGAFDSVSQVRKLIRYES